VIFWFLQFTKSPRAGSQVKQWPPCQRLRRAGQASSWYVSTNASMRPAISCPGTRGYWMPASGPLYQGVAVTDAAGFDLNPDLLRAGLGCSFDEFEVPPLWNLNNFHFRHRSSS